MSDLAHEAELLRRAASEEAVACARVASKEAVACVRQAGGGEEAVAHGEPVELRRTAARNRGKGEGHEPVRGGAVDVLMVGTRPGRIAVSEKKNLTFGRKIL